MGKFKYRYNNQIDMQCGGIARTYNLRFNCLEFCVRAIKMKLHLCVNFTHHRYNVEAEVPRSPG